MYSIENQLICLFFFFNHYSLQSAFFSINSPLFLSALIAVSLSSSCTVSFFLSLIYCGFIASPLLLFSLYYSLFNQRLSHFILLDSLFVSLYYFFYQNSPFVLIANEITQAVCFACLME